ncbi:hypothetical protein IV203_011779 [Nitzschia inconspicua]|uniref:Uncharacterized protein n=1 Tax=Nitzschia inconspicua TaxID=303405 RepID=A0A9K3PIQ3_9STRA|nr:hypothetical protein IV203_011779 [Nitzschia inconspicua]
MKLVTASIIITLAFAVAWTRHRVNQWESWTGNLMDNLVEHPILRWTTNSDTADLPNVVRKYFQAVLPSESTATTIHSVSIHQEGHFMFGSSWVPFEADQIIRAVSPLGFVWDATISMTPRFQQKDLQKSLLPTMQVCDALVDGGKRAYLRAALVNVFDSIDAKSTIEEEDDKSADEDQFLWVGEAMRWLAEAAIVPTALLPEQGMVQWHPLAGEEYLVALTLNDPRTGELKSSNRHVLSVQLQVEFDPDTGFITQVTGNRPYEREVLDQQGDLFPIFTRKRTSWEWRKWVGRFSNYERVAGGMSIPRTLQAGWVNDDGEIELYFKAHNEALVYSMTPTTTKFTSYQTKADTFAQPEVEVPPAVVEEEIALS